MKRFAAYGRQMYLRRNDPKVLSECLSEHLQIEVERDRECLVDLTNQYEVPGAVLRNLLAAQTELRRAVMSIAAASAAAAAAAVPAEAES